MNNQFFISPFVFQSTCSYHFAGNKPLMTYFPYNNFWLRTLCTVSDDKPLMISFPYNNFWLKASCTVSGIKPLIISFPYSNFWLRTSCPVSDDDPNSLLYANNKKFTSTITKIIIFVHLTSESKLFLSAFCFSILR